MDFKIALEKWEDFEEFLLSLRQERIVKDLIRTIKEPKSRRDGYGGVISIKRENGFYIIKTIDDLLYVRNMKFIFQNFDEKYGGMIIKK